MISLKQAKERVEEIRKTRTEARAGEIWSVNNKIMKGHKGQILRRKKNNIELVEITHSSKYGNLPLKENPQKDDNKKAYVVRKKQHATVRNLGKYHPDMRIKHPEDKAKVRYIKKKK